ncbi:MAG: two-component sensor histidine kinase [Flavobacteriales bacterium]|nr:two-component sensor histidine kinase [Flavobacteriales bacterium]
MDLKLYKVRWIFLLLAIYLVFQLLWWGYHLAEMHEELYQMQSSIESNQQKLHDLEATFNRKIRMVWGEGIVFTVLLFFGIYHLNKHQKLEERRARQQKNFLLAVTHELKTPVATIRLFIETLRKRELPKEKRDEILGHANKETFRLDQLVENILLSTRLEQSNQVVYEEDIAYSEFVTNLCDKMVNQSATEHILERDIEPDLVIKGEKMSLESMLVNLYENALKYGGAGVKIHIDLKKVGDQVVLTVSDNGPGIPESEKKKIFDKFYRIGNEETRSAKGTGIGLYMVKKVVESHRGTVRVLDAQPNGSSFEIMFPYGK